MIMYTANEIYKSEYTQTLYSNFSQTVLSTAISTNPKVQRLNP
jgi:hypothetical protein